MTAELVTDQPKFTPQLIMYPVSLAAIEDMHQRYMGLAVKGLDDKEGFTAVYNARQDCKTKRIAVDKRRKLLKADALEYGRQVETAAQSLIDPLRTIEMHLQDQENIIAKEKERLAAEEERERQKVIDARVRQFYLVDYLVSERDVAAMTQQTFDLLIADATAKFEEKKAAEAEARRLAEAEAARQKVEAARLYEEAQKVKAELAEIAKEREALEAEKQRIEKEKQDAEAAEQRKWIEEEEAAEHERLQAEQKAESERLAAEEAARIELLRPDMERLAAVEDAVAKIDVPRVSANADHVRVEILEILAGAQLEIRRVTKC